MVDLMTIIYYQDEYKNTKSLEAKEYLDATLAALIDYAKHIRHLILISKPVLRFLKMRVKMSYGDRLEYQRLFNAYDKEYDHLKTYNDLLLDYAKRYKTEGTYEGIDNLFILCTSLTNMIQNINQYSEYCAMLNDKNNGINSGFLPVGFDKKSEQDLEVAMEVSKVIIRG